MTEKQHDEWLASVTKAWPEPNAAAGNEAWNRYFSEQRRKSRDRIDKGLQDIIDGLNQAFRQERTRMRQQLEAAVLEVREELVSMREANATLRAENERLLKAHPRLVGGRSA